EYGIGSQILSDLGLTSIRILTNNPKKILGLESFGLRVVAQEPIEVAPNAENARYLEAKRRRMGHTLKLHHQDLRFDEDLDGSEWDEVWFVPQTVLARRLEQTRARDGSESDES